MLQHREYRPHALLISSLCALLLILSGVIVLGSWFIDSALYDVLLQNILSMKASAIVGITLSGLSLWLQRVPPAFTSRQSRSLKQLLGQLLALMVILIGSFSLAQDLFGTSSAVRQVLAYLQLDPELMRAGAMKPLNAFCLVLAGISLLWLDTSTQKDHYPTEYCSITMACIMGVPLLGYLYNATGTILIAVSSIVSVQASLFFLVLAIGILYARPQHPLMAVFTSNAPGGHLLRRLLPKTLALLIFLDLLAEWGARQGLYGQEKVSSLVTLADSAVLFILFWRAAFLLNYESDVRRQGEAALAKSTAWLRIVSDTTTDAIFVKDREGRMVFANPATLHVLGKELSSVVGCTNIDLFPNAEDAAAIAANDQYVITSGKAQAFEQTIHLPDGVRTFYATKAPWTNDDGIVLGVIGIATDISERKRTEDAIRAHEMQLEALVEERTAEVSELIGHLEATREEEKRAIARELHDDLGSALTALNMHLAIIFQQISTDPNLTERTVQVKALLNSVTATTRRIQSGLRPDKLDIFGIKTAIIELALDFENYTGVACRASLPDEDLAYTPQIEITIFRMVQEALNNIAKHAKATKVDVILDDNEDYVMLTIRDNGVGIPAGRITGNTTHGLRGMRERASYLRGKIDIASESGKGTKITVKLPKTIPARANVEHTGIIQQANVAPLQNSDSVPVQATATTLLQKASE
jgi:PAS domain S-box-containing protein